jgi:hypothetical protein
MIWCYGLLSFPECALCLGCWWTGDIQNAVGLVFYWDFFIMFDYSSIVCSIYFLFMFEYNPLLSNMKRLTMDTQGVDSLQLWIYLHQRDNPLILMSEQAPTSILTYPCHKLVSSAKYPSDEIALVTSFGIHNQAIYGWVKAHLPE